MDDKPLSYRLGTYISVAVLLVYLILIGWSFLSGRSIVIQEAENRVRLLNLNIISQVRERVVTAQEVTSHVALHNLFQYRYEETRHFLLQILNKYQYIESLQVNLKEVNGNKKELTWSVARAINDSALVYSDSPVSDVTCFDKEFISSQFSGKNGPGWSDPFLCEGKGDIFSVFYYPFEFCDTLNNVDVCGFITCELSFGFLQKLIEETKIGDHGYAFLVSDKGLFITHPLKEYQLKQTVYNLEKNIYPEQDSLKMASFLAAPENSEPVIIYPKLTGRKKSWAFSQIIPENKWILVIVMPFRELFKKLRQIHIKMLTVSILVVALVFMVVFTISRNILYPLSKISHEFRNFAADKSEPSIGFYNETKSLRESLIALQKRYENYLLIENETARNRAIFRENLQLAFEIQQSIIPPEGNHSVTATDTCLYTVFKPSRIVSGDLYDFFPIGETKLLITIGDVSGAGIPSAIFMGIAHTLIKSNALIGTAKDIVNNVNKELCKKNANQFFLTLFLGIIDTSKGILNYCNAGHTPTFLLSSRGDVTELGDPHGVPLGLHPDRYYKDSTVNVRKKDTLILYTDGITEQSNDKGDFFGVDGFYNLFAELRDKSPEEIALMIMKSIEDFSKEENQTDDLSLMIVRI